MSPQGPESPAQPPKKRSGAGARLLHAGQRLAARAFGGAYGDVQGIPLRWPQVLRLELPSLSLHALRWAAPPAELAPVVAEGERGASGVPLLLLHGLNNCAWIWARVATLMAERRRAPVVALSLRGHGGSDAPPAGYSLEQTSADLTAATEALGLHAGPWDLAGHSWGGKVALHAAATGALPGLRSVVLADPAPAQGLNALLRPKLIRAAFQPERGPFPDRDAWETAGRHLVYLQRWDPVDQRLWTANFHLRADGSYEHRLPDTAFDEIVAGPLKADMRPLLAAVSCPVLLLRPTFTVSFLPGETWPLRRRLGARLARGRVPGDHGFIHSNPADTVAAMERFYEGLGEEELGADQP